MSEKWKPDTELRCRFVVRGCFQDTAKMDDDAVHVRRHSVLCVHICRCTHSRARAAVVVGGNHPICTIIFASKKK